MMGAPILSSREWGGRSGSLAAPGVHSEELHCHGEGSIDGPVLVPGCGGSSGPSFSSCRDVLC
eukprot:762958-Hanusia_phi.AAC.13